MPAMPALFAEIEGVLIAPLGAGATSAQAELLPGVGAALARLRLRGVLVVAVTDGAPAAALFPALGEQLRRLVEREGGELRGCYAADALSPPSWRRPRPGMLLAAARELGIDLAASWMVGRERDDVLAAAQAGCAGCVLVGHAQEGIGDPRLVVAVARDLADAPRVMIPARGGCWHQ
jgi:D-glycero-D-manno-heptose 1,7-bisphosphate phosphatase